MAAEKREKSVVEMIIDGRQAELSVKDLGEALHKVSKELRELAVHDNPERHKKLLAEKRKISDEYNKQKVLIKDLRSDWEKYVAHMSTITTAVVGGNLLTTALENVASIIPKLVTGAGELSDQLADVRKQTGLAGDELIQLNDDLAKLDTRTSQKELRALAAVAGKLGYQTREEVLGFVKAADMVGVALTEDLGGNVEEAMNDLGKLVEIFGIKQEFGIEQSILKTASAINTIGASSAANEGYLVEWSKRFAGIAPNANITIADTIGMAATMDILGQSAELSSTNLGKMIVAIGKDIPHFAKVAKMSVADFTKLIQTDANEAFIRVLEGAKSSSGGLQGLVKTLESLGIEGSEGAQVLGALSKNTQLLREQQDIVNKSFTEGTSIIDEFNVKNTNTAAILDKLGKKITGWWEGASKGLDPLIIKFGQWMGVISKLDLQLGELKEKQDLVNNTEKNIVPLIARYDYLRTRVKLTTDEQTELDKITRQLADAVPQAVTEFDKYGNALGVNTWKVRDYVAEQRGLLEAMRQTRRELLQDEFMGLSGRASQLQNILNKGSRTKVHTGPGGAVTVEEKLLPDEIRAMRAELAKVQADIAARRQDLKALEGIADIAFRRNQRGYGTTPSTTKPGGITPTPGGYEGPSSKDSEELADKYERVQDELLQIKQQYTLRLLSEDEKEIQAAHYKYEKLRELAKGNAKLLAEINRTEAEEIEHIQSYYGRQHHAGVKELDFSIKPKDLTEEVAGDLKGSYDSAMAVVDSNFDKNITNINSKHAIRDGKGIRQISDADAYQQRLQAEEQYLTAKLLLQKTYGQQTVDTEREIQENFVAQLEYRYTREFELKEAMKLAEWDLQDARREAYAAGISVLSSFVDESSVLFKGLMVAEKALAIADIIIKLQREIAGYYAAGAALGPYGMALATTQATAAKIRAGISIGTIGSQAIHQLMPKKAEGGYTDVRSLAEGFVNRATLFSMPNRQYIAGEAGQEFILNNRSLRHPAVAAFANIMDAVQKSKNYGMLDQLSGGSGGKVDPQVVQLLMKIYGGIDSLSRNVSETGNRPVVFNTKTFDKHRDFIYKIQNDVNV
ncbi:phage tail tape measure protein [Telluribacter humicola]|uniref:phage tail tape measure protein n=1 Tax=Telluribacter humicola TaxID=1720261 RepID=UPI001A97A008|nr:phage tail tape measure protein [Telluribacter humicola]